MKSRSLIAGMVFGCVITFAGAAYSQAPAGPAPKIVVGVDRDPLIQPSPGLKIAVLRFESTGVDPTLGDGVAEMVAGQLSNTPGVTVIERASVEAVLREMEIQRSGLTTADAVRIGRGLNAGKVLLGSVRKFGDDAFMITARVVDVETQKIEGFREVQCQNCRERDLPDAVDTLRRVVIGAAIDPRQAAVLLQRVIQAMGGIDRIRALKTYVFTASITPQPPQPSYQMTSYVECSNRIRSEMKWTGGERALVAGADGGWVKDEKGVVQDMPADARESYLNGLTLTTFQLLLDAADGRLQVRLRPNDPGQPRSTTDTLELSGGRLGPIDLLVDRNTGIVTGKRYSLEQPGAIGKLPSEESYSDYRDVNGLQFATKTVYKSPGTTIERTMTSLKVNIPIDESLFKRPEKSK